MVPNGLFLFIVNVLVPIATGLIYFGMAKYVAYIAPMRTLVTGATTYKGAYWGFIFFGIYLASRPLQVLLGPHPMPLLINCIREFFMIGLFVPAVFVAMMSLCFGSDRLRRGFVVSVFVFGIALAGIYLAANAMAIGRSQEIFRFGPLVAHDGQWYAADDADMKLSLKILFMIRLIDPVGLLLLAGSIVLWHGWHYPDFKSHVYNNMPKKLLLLAGAVFGFALSMLMVGIVTIIGHMPNEWWIYYVGFVVAGLLETISLTLPVRRDVQVSEHL